MVEDTAAMVLFLNSAAVQKAGEGLLLSVQGLLPGCCYMYLT